MSHAELLKRFSLAEGTAANALLLVQDVGAPVMVILHQLTKELLI